MPKWHLDYERDGDAWRVICPYCKRSTTRPLLSTAFQAGIEHEAVCPSRAELEGGP
jgi:hypothetical protein